MILSSESTNALISGIISFLLGSIRQAEELSMTVVPASANLGAHSRDVLPPAENKAMSAFMSTAVCKLTTGYSFPLKGINFPTERL